MDTAVVFLFGYLQVPLEVYQSNTPLHQWLTISETLKHTKLLSWIIIIDALQADSADIPLIV